MSTNIFDDFYNLIDEPGWHTLMEKLKPVLLGDDLEQIQHAKQIMEYVGNNIIDAKRDQFEYSYYYDTSNHAQAGSLEQRLHQHSNELGAQGWEIVGMTQSTITTGYDYRNVDGRSQLVKIEGNAVRLVYKRRIQERLHLV